MKALVYEGPYKMNFHDYPECQPKEGQVKIKVRYCGICGSDLHGYTGESGRKIPPMVMGHEFSGEVVELGENCNKFKVGDRVSVLPVEYCGECEFCKKESENICANRRNLGVLDVDGAFTEYICMKEKYVYKLPDSVSYEEGAVLEPLSVAYHAAERIGDVKGKNVLIAGSGTIGLLVLMLVKIKNPEKIIVTDVRDNRLERAKKLGADIIVNPTREDLGAVLRQHGIERGVDIAVEAVGLTDACQQTVDNVRIQGSIVWIGNAAKMVTVNMQKIVTQELSVKGSYAFTAKDFDNALKLLEEKKIPASDIITKIIDFDDTTQMFESLIADPGDNIKVLVEVNK